MTKTAKRRTGEEHAENVLKALQTAEKPISAYQIMAAVPNGRDLAPATIYRALDRLVRDGQVHKLESLNAFVACQHSADHSAPAFAICSCCGTVTEPCEMVPHLSVRDQDDDTRTARNMSELPSRRNELTTFPFGLSCALDRI
jgi:Fe2+ or Zn2+ uptake regulation protein